jgi:hypothetical protein
VIFYEDKMNICGRGRERRHTREDGTSMKRGRTRERRDRARTERKMPQMAAAHDQQLGFRTSYQPTVEDRVADLRGFESPLHSPRHLPLGCSTFFLKLTHPDLNSAHLDVITLDSALSLPFFPSWAAFP